MPKSAAVRSQVRLETDSITAPDVSYTSLACVRVPRPQRDHAVMIERNISVELTVDAVEGTDQSNLLDICTLRLIVEQGSRSQAEDEHLWQQLSLRDLYAIQRTMNFVIEDAQRRKILPLEA